MESLKMPEYIMFALSISLIGLILIITNRKKLFKYNRWFWVSIAVFCFIYSLVMISAIYDDLHSQWILNQYDLNKDGIFDGSEISKQQKIAMDVLINDVGRNFSVFTGLIVAATIAIPIYIIGKLNDKLRTTKKI